MAIPYDAVASFFRTRALAVIGYDDTVKTFRQFAADIFAQLCGILADHWTVVLKIQPHHLLVLTDYANLRRSRLVCRHQTSEVNAARNELVHQTLAMVVISDKTGYRHVRPQKGKIVRHIRRPA